MMEKDEKKKRKKALQIVTLKEEEKESQAIFDLIKVLEDLEEKGELVDIQVCPKCKSAKVRRVSTTGGDMLGHMAITPVKYECLDCRWMGRLVLKASNRPLDLREVALIAEAHSEEK